MIPSDTARLPAIRHFRCFFHASHAFGGLDLRFVHAGTNGRMTAGA
jgi:hypothetical protein